MADEGHFDTRVETNRWESFTRLTFSYFADQEYAVERTFDQKLGELKLVFKDEDRGERAVFIYEGSPPDMARESLQTMQRVFEGSMDAATFWREMLKKS
jgi:hypothetical protein